MLQDLLTRKFILTTLAVVWLLSMKEVNQAVALVVAYCGFNVVETKMTADTAERKREQADEEPSGVSRRVARTAKAKRNRA